jgi:Tol biopolymer transport system component
MSDIQTRLKSALEGRYSVEREIGAGGMATVFLAHDVRHERDVAIKVLHTDLAAALGADRFLAEIKTTAKLQHPHILPLLDSGEAGGLLYYVMPYVAGESLRAKLERETQLGVDEAVRIAREVASALESAHRNGVVHRDIKPENILIREDQALVADFGIALAVSAAGGPRMTQTGLSLGTPAYMAPEQAMGERAVDGRADIYALGAVLYEMLVGEAPFTGPSVQAIVARVMTEQPRPITGQRRSVPEHVNAAVMTALEKLPADRFPSASEFSKALVTPGFEGTRAGAAVAHSAPKRTGIHTSVRSLLPWSIAGIALLLAGVSLVRKAASRDSMPLTHLGFALPSTIDIDGDNGADIGISADGTRILFSTIGAGGLQLMIRDLGKDSMRAFPAGQGSGGSIEVSPDGEWIAFYADGMVQKARAAGGPATRLAPSRWGQIGWISNEALVYTKSYDTGLSRVSAEGKDTATLTTPDRKKGELGHWWPQLLPDGEHVLFTNYHTPADESSIEVISLRSGNRRVVMESGYHARYASGYLLFARGSAIMAVPFDPDNFSTKGNPTPLPLSVHMVPYNGWAGFEVSSNGVLAYVHDPKAPIELGWVDEGGVETLVESAAGHYTEAVASPDGSRIAVVRDGDVWILNRSRNLFSRLTRTDQREVNLVWMPDSRAVIYSRDVPVYDIFRRSVDGGSPEETLVASQSDKSPTSVSPDGSMLLFDHDDEGDNVDVWFLSGPSKGSSRTMVTGTGDEENARFSPDGMWIVYASDESGRSEVYLVPHPLDRGPARQQLSLEGGFFPQWGPDGRTVYYVSSGQIVRVRVNPRTGEIGKPEILDKVDPHRFWSLGPDGRFLIGKPAQNSERRSVKIVTNWTKLLESSR